MEFEEHGDFYLQRQRIADPEGRIVEYYDVGRIIEVGGIRRYKVNSDAGFSTRAEALAWIEKQTA